MKYPARSAVFILLAACWPLAAEVFSLFPFRSGTMNLSADNAVHGSRLWTEEVDINGHAIELEVSLVKQTMQEAVRDLRGKFGNGAAAMNANSLLFEVPLASGAKKRYYLVELKGMIPMLCFSLVLPRNFRQSRSGSWPSELPLPPGAVSGTVMRFPKRSSVYGTFRSPFPPQQTLADLVRDLLNHDWKIMGRENTSSFQASGEIFLREKKQEILIVSVQNSDSGSIGSLYLRRLSGK